MVRLIRKFQYPRLDDLNVLSTPKMPKYPADRRATARIERNWDMCMTVKESHASNDVRLVKIKTAAERLFDGKVSHLPHKVPAKKLKIIAL